jgi:hypothetical protein
MSQGLSDEVPRGLMDEHSTRRTEPEKGGTATGTHQWAG